MFSLLNVSVGSSRNAARRAGAALAAGSLLGVVALVEPVTAQASPLDPGLDSVAASFTVTNCSAPQAIAGHPDQSRVTCGVGAHQFVVPAGVSSLRVDVRGAAGGSGGGGAPGGAGGRIRTSIFVWPGEVLEMAVGGRGDNHEHGGFNGGGDGARPGATGVTASGGGGGSSDIRIGVTGPWSRIISAAGGGGGGGSSSDRRYDGGAGGRNALAGARAPGAFGGRPGLPATWVGSGAGGSAGAGGGSGGGGSAGGAIGGAPGSTRTLIGGAGGIGVQAAPSAGDGGAGGGGYGFGGGGAGGVTGTVASARGARPAAGGGGGGGGGSSYVNYDWVRFQQPVLHTPGFSKGNGSISIVYNAPPLRCGQTIYASMTLTTDLNCNVGDPLIIGGLAQQTRNTGIVFDLGGHTVSGGPDGTGIELQQDGITIRNGTLRGFGTAISSPGLSGYAGVGAEDLLTLNNLTIADGTVGVSIHGGFGLAARIDHTVISGMSSAGITAGGQGGGRLTVTNSTIENSVVGVASSDVLAVVLRNDVVTGNTGGGIAIVADTIIVSHNTVLGNGSGISAVAPTDQDAGVPVLPAASVKIRSNVVGGNAGTGLALSGRVGPGSVVAGNRAVGNGLAPAAGDPGDGILVQLAGSPSNLSLTANAGLGNAGWGIDAVGVTDGGGNLGAGNAAGRDCRGVVCTVS